MRNLQTFKETFFSSCDAFYRKVISKRKTVLHAVIVVFALFFAPLPVSEALASDSVSSSGAFMLPIPIVTPPGRAGIQPALTLTYNSQGLNGWVGAGWSLGVGDIHRRLKNGVKYEDGEYEVNNTKLIRVREWDINGHHAYAPETQTDFTKYFIKLHNNKESETLGWVVHTKDGKILEYGTTADSKQAFKSKTRFANNSYYHVFKWCLNKVTDANGNYMEISYDKHRISYSDDDDMEYGVQVYLKEIDYTGNENGTGTTNKVIFHLEDRTDHNSNYLTNYEVRTEKRLKSIEVRNNDSMVRAYALEYDESDHTSRSRLKSVTQYGDDATINADGEVSGTSLPPHRFEYEGFNVDKSHFEQATASKSGGIDYYGRRDGWVNWTVTGDFNGDGNTDLVATKYVEGGRKKTTFLMYDHSTQTFDEPTNNQWDLLDTLRFQLGSEQSYLISNDFDRDGRDDLFVYSQALDDGNLKPIYYNLYFSRTYDGVQTFSLASSNHCSKISEWHFKVSLGDFNGDGLSDLLYSGRGPKKGRYMMALYDESTKCFNKVHEGYYSEDGNENNNIYDELIPKIGDFNGDGKSDVLLVDARFHGIDKSGYRLFISNGSSLVYKSERVLTETAENKFFEQPKGIGDFNGDGKADLFFHYKAGNYNKLLVYHSDGENLNPAFDSKSDAGNLPTDEADMYIGDFNGDNRNDIMAVYKNNTGCDFYLLENNKPVKIERDKIQECTQMYNFALADYNGDGATDFMTLRSLGVTNDKNPLLWALYPSQEDSETISGNFDLLTKHTNSLGGITSVNYQPSSDQDMTEGTMANLHRLPFVLYLVRSVTLDDRVNNTGDDTATFTYSYNEGKYDFPTREFRGFDNIIKTDPLYIKTIKYFYQDKERKGILKKTRKYLSPNDNDGYFQSTQHWKVDNSSNANNFLYLDYTNSYFSHLNEDGTSKKNNENYVFYSYDNHGNTLSVIKSDIYSRTTGIKTEFVYENKNPDMWIWRKTSEIIKENQADNFAKKTTFTYDIMGNLTRKRSYIDISQSIGEDFRYDTYGNLTSSSVRDGIPNTYQFEYDSTKTYLAKKTLPTVGSTTLIVFYTYNTSYGQIATEKDENGNVTTYHYDKFGRQERVDYPDDGWTTTSYSNPLNTNEFTSSTVSTRVNLIKNNTSNSHTAWSKKVFDGMGREIKALSKQIGGNVVIQTDYDKLGRVWGVYGPQKFNHGNTTSLVDISYPFVRTTYDGLSRPLSITRPNPNGDGDNAVTTYSYDGYVTTITEPARGEKRETKNYLDRVTRIEECCDSNSDLIETNYYYDTVGNLVKVTDTEGNDTTMEYDMLGRRTGIIDPDTGTTEFEYDKNNNLQSQTDNAGVTITFTYDKLNRVTKKTYGTNTNEYVDFSYDTGSNGKGKLASISRSNSSDTIKTDYETYDKMGRITKVKQTNFDLIRITEYGYDVGGRLTLITYPYKPDGPETDKMVVEYTYYSGTHLIKRVFSGSTVYANFSDYLADGNIGTIDFGNDLQTEHIYYANSGNLKQILTGTPNSLGSIMNLEYTYFSGGNIETKKHTKNSLTNTNTYAYDPLGRLISATNSPLGNIVYRYNDIGNIMSRKVGSTLYSYTYESDKPHAVTNITKDSDDVNHPFVYDDNGNLKSGPEFKAHETGEREFTYNPDNMPVEILSRVPDHDCPLNTERKKIRLYYNGEGERTVKEIWDTTWGNNVYKGRVDYFNKIFRQYTFSDDNINTTSYIFAGNLRIAEVKKNSNTTIRYLHKDHLGSTTVTTNENGTDSKETRYLPYGDNDGSLSTNYQFTDQELDDEVGLYNYKARMYDPAIGRFTTADSIVPDLYSSQGLNRYSYCVNNPLRYTDPTGHSWKVPLAIIGTAVTLTVALPVVIALGVPAATVAVVTAWAAKQTAEKLVINFHIGIMAKMYDQTVVPYVQDTFGLNDWETSVFSAVSFMGFYSATGAFGLRTWRTMAQLYLDLQEGAIRGFMLGALNEFFEGESSPYKFIFKTAIQRATDVRGKSKYLALWAMDYMDYRDENQSKRFEIDIGDSLNSAFSVDLTGFSESTSKGIDYIRITKDFSSNYGNDWHAINNEIDWGFWGSNDSENGLLQSSQNSPSCELFDDFSGDSGWWTYTGYSSNAKAYRYEKNNNGHVVLTENEDWVAGVIWLGEDIYKEQMVVDFRYKAGVDGADGLAMMFYKDKDYKPSRGGDLGFMGIKGNGSVDVSGYGIEFDSNKNSNHSDPSYNHIALIKDSVNNHLKQAHDYRVNDNAWHDVKVIKNNTNIKVYVDDMTTVVLEKSVSFDRDFGGFGFGGATATRSQTHLIDDVRIMIPVEGSYTVTASAGKNGSISPSGTRTVDFDDTTTFTVTPATGYHIRSVTGCNGTLNNNTYETGPVTRDCEVTALFSYNPKVTSVILYKDKNFSGEEWVFEFESGATNIKVSQLPNRGVPNNAISSIRVGSAVEVFLHNSYNYGGKRVRFTQSESNLGDFDDKASSMIIIPSLDDYSVRLYKDLNFSGNNKTFYHNKEVRNKREATRISKLYFAGFSPNNSLSSIVIGSKVEVYLFRGTHYEGAHLRLKKSIQDLSNYNFNDTASSMLIKNEMNTYKVRLYKDKNFMGFQRTLGDGKKGNSPRKIASVEHIGVDHDIISSIDVGDDITVCLYENSHYNYGLARWFADKQTYRLRSSHHNFSILSDGELGNFDNLLSSMIIYYEKNASCPYGAVDP